MHNFTTYNHRCIKIAHNRELSEMSPNLVCRLCLAVEVRLLSITGSLQEVYEKLTDTVLHSLDARPLVACYLCHAQLRKCRRLMLGSARAEALLTDMLQTSSKISPEMVSSIDRFANGLCSLAATGPKCLETIPPEITSAFKRELNADDIKSDVEDSVSDDETAIIFKGRNLKEAEAIAQTGLKTVSLLLHNNVLTLDAGPQPAAEYEVPLSVSHLCDAVMDTAQRRRRGEGLAEQANT
ncbi:uncharacterized protein LOC128682221 isoform X6 [Plodia interpunctella]|uniref:uncharacterized protein LOC128682221 isoform X6 n=1 Tax=Plodia interpunctella TaxID=58824 RepID=UPI002368853B|nr:uncharacterized protein LOC128682221 isoform X6 [Plodia interpunctella]